MFVCSSIKYISTSKSKSSQLNFSTALCHVSLFIYLYLWPHFILFRLILFISSARNMLKMHILQRICIASCLLVVANCLMFRLPANSRRCLKEEVHKGVLVSGEYDLSDAPGQKTDLMFTDTKGHILVSRENIDKGKFAFVTDDYDVFEACFISKSPAGQRGQDRDVILTLKHGVEAKSYDSIAEVGKLKPLEVELQKLEDLSESIVKDFAYMRQRESEMRDTNESTNSRVLYFSIFSMCCLLGLATWQVLYLRRFFKAKKLIE